jgi:hypothetical protein
VVNKIQRKSIYLFLILKRFSESLITQCVDQFYFNVSNILVAIKIKIQINDDALLHVGLKVNLMCTTISL